VVDFYSLIKFTESSHSAHGIVDSELTMKKHVIILGAGISGLSLAWYLNKKFADAIKITIIEEKDISGGWIKSIRKDGFLFELGPHSCRASGTGLDTLQLIEELNLTNEVVCADSSAKKRYLYFDKHLHQVPGNLFSLLFSPVTKGLSWALLKELSKPVATLEDESIYDFFCRRFNQELTERLIDPLVSGIYAGNIKNLSMASCFSKLFEYEKQHGSLLKGMIYGKKTDEKHTDFVNHVKRHGLFSFRDGMDTLTKKLESFFRKSIIFSTKVHDLKIQENQIIAGTDKGPIEADYFFNTASASAFAKIVQKTTPKLSLELNSIKYTSLISVNIGYSENVIDQKGFGYLVPSKEKENILGCIWGSKVFPSQNNKTPETRLTVMLGGEHRPDILSYNDEEIFNVVKKSIFQHLKIDKAPKACHIQRLVNAIPQYPVGHRNKIKLIESELQRLGPIFCLGTALYGVSVNDCIVNARKTALNLNFY